MQDLPATARRSLVVLLGGASLASLVPATSSAAETGYKRSPRGVPYEDLSGEGEAAGGSAPSSRRVEAGDEVVVDYTLRRSNGYFIFSTVEGVSFQPLDVPAEPFRFVVGDDARVIPGLSDVVLGMTKGGRRRALVPPRLGYTYNTDEERADLLASQSQKGQPQQQRTPPKVLTLEPIPPTFATKRQLLNHCVEPLLFEIQVVTIKKNNP